MTHPKNLLRRARSFLRLGRPAPAAGGAKSRPFDHDEIVSRAEPRLAEAWWSVYRFFKWHKAFHPTQMWREARWFAQRGRRGWADCDTWSLDDYLDGWLPAAIRHLKEHKRSVPWGMFEGLPTENDDGYTHSEETFKVAEARWDEIMDKMAAAFEANGRISCGLYEEELGPYESSPARHARAEGLRARDEGISREGMALFVEHYRDLWD